ncbi:Tfp pilus assembly protein PilX [Aquitalea magnusonii]|uniref:Tfp pilus assembly protein PilX n=2 Tax=Aquitalea magnusonii TaxID=332411 RepID=A0A318JCH5_9NEIS|nr:Tfp pilus assembly protein PilX [Aquitalea magnusonii]
MRQGARGVVLLTALLLLLLMSALVLGLSRLLRDEQRIGSQLDDAQRAFQLAELGLQAGEQALAKLPFAAQVAGMSHSALRQSESPFTLSCRQSRNPAGWQQGLCLSATLARQPIAPPWQRLDESGVALLHPCGVALRLELQSVATAGRCPVVTTGPWFWSDPHYLLELLDPQYVDGEQRGLLLRVTARGWGRLPDSAVTVQSHVLLLPESTGSWRVRRLAWRELR